MTVPGTRPEGRLLDAEVAEKVMGWRHDATPEENAAPGSMRLGFTHYRDAIGEVMNPLVPRCSTDIAAAWLVVEKMRERGVLVDVESLSATYRVKAGWEGREDEDIWNNITPVDNESAPLAICLAALQAVAAAVLPEPETKP